MRKIGDFEIIDHGILDIDFPGCENDDFEYVVTGIGNNMAEAINNCLNQMLMSDFDIEDMEVRILEQREWDLFPIKPSLDGKDKYGEQKRHVEYYHVSIQWDETHKLPVRIGGLMRCCIKTLATIDDS